MSQSVSFIITEESEKSSGVRGIRFTQRNRGNRERPERGFWEILSQVIVSFVRGTISSVERGDPSGGGGVGSWIFSFISAFLWIFSVTLCEPFLLCFVFRTFNNQKGSCIITATLYFNIYCLMWRAVRHDLWHKSQLCQRQSLRLH